ncbi:hypothetical protein B0H14DRAFT_2557079 [Mycena olivaceomarginata]|nr:hypothetical protein B0H14DRAFT_2557079 [Mycena olivaceomarginata]
MFPKFSLLVASVLITLAAAGPIDCGAPPPPASSLSQPGYPSQPSSLSQPGYPSQPSSPTQPGYPSEPSSTPQPSSTAQPSSSAPASSPSQSSSPSSPQCCSSVIDSTSAAASHLVGLLGIDLSGITGSIGLGCSPITVLGNNCGGTTVTCNAPTQQTALIAIGCIPITL